MTRPIHPLRAKIWNALEGYGPLGTVIQVMIVALVVVSLVLPVLDTLEDMEPYHRLIDTVGWSIAFLFACDYALRVAFAPDRRRYMTSAAGIIDFLAVVPFVASLGMIDSQALRLLRIIRILHAVKIARYSEALTNLRAAFHSVRAEMVVYAGLSSMLLYVSSIAIYHFEHEAQPEIFGSVFDALWWSAVTLSTVGYGDVYPKTVGGRVFSLAVIVTGIGVVSVPSSLMAAALVRQRQDRDDEQRQPGESPSATPSSEPAQIDLSNLPPDFAEAVTRLVTSYRTAKQ